MLLAITGAPHNHSYKEINGKSDLKLNVHCMYLNKTFEIKNVNPQDSISIKSSSFKNSKQRTSLNKNNLSDSIRFFNWRIGDLKYHKNITKDTIEIFQITDEGIKNNYIFVSDSN